MNLHPDVFDGWKILERELPPNYRELAETMGLIHPVPAQLNAKITDASDLLRLLLHHATGSSSLELTTARAGATGLPTISAVALHKWERKAAPWLGVLVAEMLRADGASANFEGGTVGGYHLVAVDGTSLSRPGATGTTARIHYAIRLPGLELVRCEATDVHGGETLRRFDVQPGELWMGDRAYGTPPGVAAVVNQGGDVLVRINKTNLPLFAPNETNIDAQGGGVPVHIKTNLPLLAPNETKIDIDAELRTVAERGVPRERVACVHGPEGEVIHGRLCILWLPEPEAESARQRTRREKRENGEALTEDALWTAEYVIIFTTADAKRIPTDLVFCLYRARWQVELQVKRSKSIGHVDRLPNFREDTVAAWLYANLLMQQVARRLVDLDAAFPPSESRAKRSSRAVAEADRAA